MQKHLCPTIIQVRNLAGMKSLVPRQQSFIQKHLQVRSQSHNLQQTRPQQAPLPKETQIRRQEPHIPHQSLRITKSILCRTISTIHKNLSQGGYPQKSYKYNKHLICIKDRTSEPPTSYHRQIASYLISPKPKTTCTSRSRNEQTPGKATHQCSNDNPPKPINRNLKIELQNRRHALGNKQKPQEKPQNAKNNAQLLLGPPGRGSLDRDLNEQRPPHVKTQN